MSRKSAEYSARAILIALSALHDVDPGSAQESAPSRAAPTSASQPATVPSNEEGGFELRVSPFLELHYLVRALAAADDPPGAPSSPAWSEAVAAVRDLERELGGSAGWGLLDALLCSAETLDAAAGLIAAMPERFPARSGREIPIRALAQRLVVVYRPISDDFERRLWPQRRALLEQQRARLCAELLPRAAECRRHICDALHISDPGVRIPLFLVSDAPDPGGVTFRTRGGCVCVVEVAGFEDSLLYEVVLHEAIHALDVSAARQNTALQRVRAGLTQAGHAAGSAAAREVPHTLIFVQAAETVRRVMAPDHRHYGEQRGYYAKVAGVAGCVRSAWTEHLDGRMTLELAIERIIGCAVQEP